MGSENTGTPRQRRVPKRDPAAPQGKPDGGKRVNKGSLVRALGFEGERMSRVDTAWLRMDSEHNHMTILGVWLLRPGISLAELRQRVQERMLVYKRFRQIAREDATGAHWIEDTSFDLARHVSAHKLKPGKGQTAHQALQTRVAKLAAQGLDRSHPLWHFELVDGVQGGSAMIARIHHCIADGIALISVMMSLVDDGAPPKKLSLPSPGVEPDAMDPLDALQSWLADTLVRPLGSLTAKTLETAGGGAASSLAWLGAPQESWGKSLGLVEGLARNGMQLVSDLAALALMPDDSPTRLKGTPGGAKKVAWCEPISLHQVKAVGKAMNCSINDVLLSCVAGAIGTYLQNKGDETHGHEIRAMVPINLRPMEDAWKLGNQFGLVPLTLPVGIPNPLERLFEVRRRMSELKGSMQPLLTYALLSLAGILVKPAQDALMDLFGRKTTAVMTNVPGPAQKLKMCGSTLEQTMFWVPQTGTVGMGVSILSYGGGVQFGLISDTALCDDPQAIIDRFTPAFESLLTLTLMLPWGDMD
ncbi:wax ester/triacylglycerol synthase family O-acyltransferase [Hydrogenophaga sp. 5NK40-0174]|uniref:wax ester/triacylglycerol synthase family O-acyltransferase n=1 Tax=Hydrogenophaga sp. 5NK40-0174 TaxID=3127649 RepID=UPI0031049BE4